MALIAHLSDLHLLQNPSEQRGIFDSLVQALAAERELRGEDFELLAITGDVFDDAIVEPSAAAREFVRLHERLVDAMGSGVATVIVPGNHDRRRVGLFAPHRTELFDALNSELGERAWVHGCDTPFLSRVVDGSYHGLPLWLIAYDSTFLPRGLLSAGGLVRQEDLLYAASQIQGDEPDWPVLFMLHHHLVPTPLTDLHSIAYPSSTRIVRIGLEQVLPWLVAHADREELTMTALGAGTAISTLHSLGRAVLVLHGHKHYATARMLDGTFAGQGDVLIVSAGSAGTAQEWMSAPLHEADTARLWPSFNVVALEGSRLEIDVVSFGWKGRNAGRPERRPLLRAERHGAQWHQEPVDPAELSNEPARLALNQATYHVTVSDKFGAARWDYGCVRRLKLEEGMRLSRYGETVAGDDGANLVMESGAREPPGSYPMPSLIHLSLDGETRFRVEGGMLRMLNGLHHRHADRHPPFASLSLMNRYASGEARLDVRGLGSLSEGVFASATDLGTGLERPVGLEKSAEQVSVSYRDCPPRTLIRAYWPLCRSA